MNNDLTEFFGGNPFTPATVEPTTDFEVLPPGKYSVLIEAAEVKQTKKGTGHYVKLTMSVLDEQYKNRKLWDQINIDNPSTECVEIGMRTLSALGRALGIQAIENTTQLLNGVVVAHVKVKGDQNSVRTYSAASTATDPAPPAGFPGPVARPAPQESLPLQQTPVQSTGKPPWMK